MKKNVFFCICLIFFSILSCNEKKEVNTDDDEFNDVNTPCKILNYEKVLFPDDLEFMDSRYYVCNDTILLVLHDKKPDPYYLSVVNLNNFEVINRMFYRDN